MLSGGTNGRYFCLLDMPEWLHTQIDPVYHFSLRNFFSLPRRLTVLYYYSVRYPCLSLSFVPADAQVTHSRKKKERSANHKRTIYDSKSAVYGSGEFLENSISAWSRSLAGGVRPR